MVVYQTMFDYKCVYKSIILMTIFVFIISCNTNSTATKKHKIAVTNDITKSIVVNIGGDFIDIASTIASGYDPHTYKTNENDIIRIAGSSIFFYNGSFLEGQLAELLYNGKTAGYLISTMNSMENKDLITSNYKKTTYDPHFWHDINLYIIAVNHITNNMIAKAPINERLYAKNEDIYITKLTKLTKDIDALYNSIPIQKRKLATIHKGFEYLAKQYNFQTLSLQDVTTADLVTSESILNFINTVNDKEIKYIFIENTTSVEIKEKLQDVIDRLSFDIELIESIYSDTLIIDKYDNPDYNATMLHNANMISSTLNTVE